MCYFAHPLGISELQNAIERASKKLADEHNTKKASLQVECDSRIEEVKCMLVSYHSSDKWQPSLNNVLKLRLSWSETAALLALWQTD